jgi:uncharacterized membrane protein YfcA
VFGTIQFAKAGHLQWKKGLPFMIASIPMAWLGGTINVSRFVFTLLLGASLLVAAARMLWIGRPIEAREIVTTRTIWSVGLPLGALLGLLAGIVGIGGGIYLAPVLLFLGWADAKQTAALSSCFILVNSVAGLLGQASQGFHMNYDLLLPLLVAVLLGGQIGSRVGALALPKVAMQRVTGLLILAVSGRLLWSLL